MGENSGIEWTDHTMNFWTGCTRVSPGCDHCYAAALSKRSPGSFGSWEPGAPRKRTSIQNWNLAHRWNRQAEQQGRRFRVFASSMADFFDNKAPEEWRDDAWEIIRATPHLIWLILTKRPQNIVGKMLPDDWGDGYANVALGTTVENEEERKRRLPMLSAVPARARFLSCEPLLEPLRLSHWLQCGRIHWVIAGGESGPGFRPVDVAWIRGIRDQCDAAGVAFFAKQMSGARKPLPPLPADLIDRKAFPAALA